MSCAGSSLSPSAPAGRRTLRQMSGPGVSAPDLPAGCADMRIDPPLRGLRTDVVRASMSSALKASAVSAE